LDSINKLKIVNDPIYGFITVPTEGIYHLIEHPYFQRLRRISQMGLSYLVYPGAHHTRFQHAMGAMHLAHRAVQVLRSKGVDINTEEEHGLLAAVLLHDIGHGPFSHALEHSLVEGIDHEEISLAFMQALNAELGGSLTLAISMFRNEYSRPFFHQLISGQLDMDRLDYIKRDSFYTGVSEGAINSERLISMMNVFDGQLVLDEKGIYSVEKFIIARRFMYWQVYLHKTGLVAEQLLTRALRRAKALVRKGGPIVASPTVLFFLERQFQLSDFSPEVIQRFAQLDDSDITWSLKQWVDGSDPVLSRLSTMLLDRDLLAIELREMPYSSQEVEQRKQQCVEDFGVDHADTRYFVFTGSISNRAYNMEQDTIKLLTKQGDTTDVAQASDQLNLKALSKTVVKHYLCFPKQKN
jgi:HD superfamily phosphohydrolase